MLVRPILSKVTVSVTLVLLLIGAFFVVGANRAEAASSTGSLSLVCEVDHEGETVLLSGDEYSIARVASADVSAAGEVSYETLPEFSQFECDWGSLSADELSYKAELLQRYAYTYDLFDQSSITDSSGTVSFSGLEPGMYLVSRTEPAAANEDYVTVPFLVSIPTVSDGYLVWDVRAYPKFEYDVVRIRPANMTIYMGGNDGYANVNGAEGASNDSLPIPMYVIEAPDGVDPEDIVFEDVVTGGNWAPVFIGHDEEGNACYRLDRLNDQAEEVKVSYVTPEGNLVSQDEFVPRIEQDLYKIYGIEITESDRRTVLAHANDRTYSVSAGDAVLTVRAVADDSIAGNSSNPVTAIIGSEPPFWRVPAEVGVVAAPEGTVFTLNETDVEMGSLRDASGSNGGADIGLLFDSIINDVYDRESALKDKVDGAMPEVAEGSVRHYQSKYLDLVDMNDGNAWVTASNPVEVYWGYPEGTDQNTKFSLWHFEGLHRDGTDNPSESGYDLEDIAQVDPEAISIENTAQGIKFSVPPGGFSPFVLVWEESGDEASDGGVFPEGPWSTLLPKTGDPVSIVALILAVLVVSLLVARTALRKKMTIKK